MTKRRLHHWLNDRKDEELHQWIIRDRKKIQSRLSERELDLLFEIFDLTGYVDLYGRLEEYLGAIRDFVRSSVELHKDLAGHLDLITAHAAEVKRLQKR